MDVGIYDGVRKAIKGFPKLWKKFTCCDIIGFVWKMLILFPYLVEGAVVSLLLSPLIFIGVVYRQIKHHIPIAWLVLVILLNIASIADLATDVTMLVKYIIPYYFETNGGTKTTNEESGELTTEESLFYWRLILTLTTALPGVILMFLVDSIQAKEKGEKSTTFRGGMIGLLGLMVGWKLAMVGIRVYMIKELIVSFVKYRKLEHKVENKIQWLELVATLDVIWSAVPLGILTALEKFYFAESLSLDMSGSIEMVKLIALLIDLVGVSYLIYFELLGLEHKWFGHHDHKSVNSEHKEPLLSKA